MENKLEINRHISNFELFQRKKVNFEYPDYFIFKILLYFYVPV